MKNYKKIMSITEGLKTKQVLALRKFINDTSKSSGIEIKAFSSPKGSAAKMSVSFMKSGDADKMGAILMKSKEFKQVVGRMSTYSNGSGLDMSAFTRFDLDLFENKRSTEMKTYSKLKSSIVINEYRQSKPAHNSASIKFDSLTKTLSPSGITFKVTVREYNPAEAKVTKAKFAELNKHLAMAASLWEDIVQEYEEWDEPA